MEGQTLCIVHDDNSGMLLRESFFIRDRTVKCYLVPQISPVSTREAASNPAMR